MVWVKRSFFKLRRFLHAEDLDIQLQPWIEEVNEQIAQDLDLRFPVRVGPTGMVSRETTTRCRQRLSTSRRPCTCSPTACVSWPGDTGTGHPRLHGRSRIFSLPDHRADLRGAVSSQIGCSYVKRQQLVELGPDAGQVLTELGHRRTAGVIYSRAMRQAPEQRPVGHAPQ